MELTPQLAEIVAIIKDEMARVNARELILFGSRANGTARPDSDYDFLILTDDSLPPSEFSGLSFTIQSRLWKSGKLAPLDLVVKNRSRFLEESESLGSLAYHVQNGGIRL